MNNDYTHVTYVLDRSGSMSSCWADTIGGLNQLIKEQKGEPGKCTFSLVAFDTEYEQPLNFSDIKLVSEKVEEYAITPRGGTALYDALARSIKETGDKLRKMPEARRPGKVLFIVQTDGEENSSREFSMRTGGAAKIKEMIKEQREKYSWSFMFLGASEDSLKDAVNNLGFAADSAAKYDTKNALYSNQMFSCKVSGLRSAKSQDEVLLATTYLDSERLALTK